MKEKIRKKTKSKKVAKGKKEKKNKIREIKNDLAKESGDSKGKRWRKRWKEK